MTDSKKKEEKQVDSKRELKNAVFAAQQAADAGGLPMESRYDAGRREMSIDIPLDQVPLPSAGKVYPPDHPLYLASSVDYRSMTAREEDILMSAALIKKGTVVSELIKACLVNPDIDVSSLLSGDRNALMIAIRASGYGQIYDPEYTCPECSFKNELAVDLNQIPIKPLVIEPVALGLNEFEFRLPVTGKRCTFKFLTGREEEEILAMSEMRKKKGLQSSVAVTTRLFYSLVEVDGNRDRSFISKFSQLMPARDSVALRKFIDDSEPGVDLTIEFTCKGCNYGEEMQMPMSSNFFWPNAK